jgi:hypothetical protein
VGEVRGDAGEWMDEWVVDFRCWKSGGAFLRLTGWLAGGWRDRSVSVSGVEGVGDLMKSEYLSWEDGETHRLSELEAVDVLKCEVLPN